MNKTLIQFMKPASKAKLKQKYVNQQSRPLPLGPFLMTLSKVVILQNLIGLPHIYFDIRN